MRFKAKLGELTFDLDAEADTPLKNIKEIVEMKSGVSSNSQKWIYQGRILADDLTVQAAGIIEGNVVHIVKTASQKPSNIPAANPSSTVTPGYSPQRTAQPSMFPQQNLISPSPYLQLFDKSMKRLLANNEADAKVAVDTLVKIVKNIIYNPLEEKYRRLKSTNVTVQKKLLSLAGATDCLQALGFIFDNGDWVLAPTPEKWDNLLICKDKLERFQQLLESVNERASNSKVESAVSAPVGAPTPTTESSALNSAASALDQEALTALQTMIAAFAQTQISGDSSSTANSSGDVPPPTEP